MIKKFRSIICLLLFIGTIGLVSFIRPISNKNMTIKTEYVTIKDTLTDWQVFVMALIEVECERNPKARSHKNAIGPLQITEIYVKEVNRLYKTNYVFEDAWDLNKSLEMFNLMNQHYNPDKNIDKAIKMHNPGAGNWYSKRIKKRMELIRFNEEVRKILLQ